MDDIQPLNSLRHHAVRPKRSQMRQNLANFRDVYFSADVETDGPIPGPYSMLSFALVYAGTFDGTNFCRPSGAPSVFYRELQPISNSFQQEALNVNRLDRDHLMKCGENPVSAMSDAAEWIRHCANGQNPVLVAYPLSFDWSWLYWYFVQYSETQSPFEYSQCFDIKTALAIKLGVPIGLAGRSKVPNALASRHAHTHHAVDDAIEQAEIFAKIFELGSKNEYDRKT